MIDNRSLRIDYYCLAEVASEVDVAAGNRDYCCQLMKHLRLQKMYNMLTAMVVVRLM